MAFSSLATVAIVLGCLAVAVAVGAGVMLLTGRRRVAERALPAFLVVLAGGILLSFAAAAESANDLQRQAKQTVADASTAERAELARTGRFTRSVYRLERLNHGLATEIKVDGAVVVVLRARDHGVLLKASLGPGTRAQATLYPPTP
jgi:predicted membrane-bound mannosyltransferase